MFNDDRDVRIQWFSNDVPRQNGAPEEMARRVANIAEMFLRKMKRQMFAQKFFSQK